MARLEVDVCVVGGGSAGLSVAAGTAQLGLRTVLAERGKMGGECLNYGCVPSKALLAAAKAAHNGTPRGFTGIVGSAPAIAFGEIRSGTADVIAAIAPNDSVERFARLGVHTLNANATFSGPHRLLVGDDVVLARNIVLATGSSPTIPDIPGLDAGKALTNETIFALAERPTHLVILGGGPVGVEMAFAHRRLGIPVTLINRSAILSREEPEHVETLRQVLRGEGIDTLERCEIVSVEHAAAGVSVHVRDGFTASIVSGSHLLIATGRTPRLEALGLEAAGITRTAKGIVVDRRLRTSQRHVYALGDAIDGPHFTHAAGYQAGIVVANLAFRLPVKVDYRALPRALYTDPELAHVGLTEAEARLRHGDKVQIELVPLGENDRAIAERRQTGSIKLVLGRRGAILGVSILAPSAGEMLGLWCLMVKKGASLRTLANLTLPYPTMSEIGRAAAQRRYRGLLLNKWVHRLVRMLRAAPEW